MTIEISSEDPRSIKAISIAAGASAWIKCTLRGYASRKAYGIPSQRATGQYHLTNTTECSCYDFQHRHEACKHSTGQDGHAGGPAALRAREGAARPAEAPRSPRRDSTRGRRRDLGSAEVLTHDRCGDLRQAVMKGARVPDLTHDGRDVQTTSAAHSHRTPWRRTVLAKSSVPQLAGQCPTDLVLERLPSGELAWLRPSTDRAESDDALYVVTDLGRRDLAIAALFGRPWPTVAGACRP
jgi:hypothetical protein